MVIFHSYVSLPEGNSPSLTYVNQYIVSFIFTSWNSFRIPTLNCLCSESSVMALSRYKHSSGPRTAKSTSSGSMSRASRKDLNGKPDGKRMVNAARTNQNGDFKHDFAWLGRLMRLNLVHLSAGMKWNLLEIYTPTPPLMKSSKQLIQRNPN